MVTFLEAADRPYAGIVRLLMIGMQSSWLLVILSCVCMFHRGLPGVSVNAIRLVGDCQVCLSVSLISMSCRWLPGVFDGITDQYVLRGDFQVCLTVSLISVYLAGDCQVCLTVSLIIMSYRWVPGVFDCVGDWYVSQVISGLMQADETVIISRDHCIQLFANETTRVFHDRLVDQKDCSTFFSLFSNVLYNNFKVRFIQYSTLVFMIAFLRYIHVRLFCSFVSSSRSYMLQIICVSNTLKYLERYISTVRGVHLLNAEMHDILFDVIII